jgi:outer membrane lipoprotein-sorting protein
VHRRSLIIIAIVAILAVTGAAVGIVEARAQGEPSLATIAPAQLLANVAQHAGDVKAVSGDVSWKNNVLGLSMLSFGSGGSGDLTALLSNGSGRVWVQGEKARFEIQGSSGDTTVIGGTTGIWVYSSTKNTATEYTFPAKQAGATGTTTQTTEATVADPVAAIEQYIQKLAPDATLAVSPAVKVAGRSCYVLSLVPKASNTVLGSVQVAIDSETYVPLHFDVYAKGTADPVLTAGFTSVSYSSIGDDIFAFTPPANATVTHKALSLPAMTSGTQSSDSATKSATEPASLTIAEAAAKAGFTPLAAQTTDAALAFGGAYVIPAQQVDLQALLGKLQAGGFGALDSGNATSSTVPSSTDTGVTLPTSLPSTLTSGPVTLGPAVIQRYGQGFGTVVLVEAKIPTELSTTLEQTLAAVPLFSRTTVGSTTLYQLNTALGSVTLWDKEGLLFVVAGSVTQTSLTEFIASVR